MGLLITVICVLTLGLTAVWFSPLRGVLIQLLSRLSRFKFTCKVTVLTDESLPGNEGDALCVQMIGCLATPCDNFDTEVRLEIDDITAGTFHVEQVLSADPQYRCGCDAAFSFQVRNGRVPRKNAVLSHWITVATIPCSVLRFAYRGRRKLQCKLSVLSGETGDVLTTGQCVVEYVSCCDGYRQIQDRKLDILKASVQLSMMVVPANAVTAAVRQVWVHWLDQIGRQFPAASQLGHSLDDLQIQIESLTITQAAEPLLAFGDQADQVEAFELVLKVLAAGKNIRPDNANTLSEIAAVLGIKFDRFLVLCQRILLQEGCQIVDPSFLLGVDAAMDQQTFRSRLNEEYRKWNCRVTHPDKEIRYQADRMLTLIADLRSCQLSPGCQ